MIFNEIKTLQDAYIQTVSKENISNDCKNCRSIRLLGKKSVCIFCEQVLVVRKAMGAGDKILVLAV